MNRFKNWLEQEDQEVHLNTMQKDRVKEIWDRVMEELGGEMRDRSDIAKATLNDLTRARKPGKTASQAFLDTVGPLFDQLRGISTEYAGRVKEMESWLGADREEAAPDRRLNDLMKLVFGDEHEKWLGNDFSSEGEQGKLTKAPPMPPLDSGSPPIPDMPQPDPNDPNAAPQQQPQVPSAGPMMQPTNPMPALPQGARMGLY